MNGIPGAGRGPCRQEGAAVVEKMIVGQYFGNAQRSLGDHRPAIGQAVSLVGPGLGKQR